jgi:hypothetical protein
METTLVSKPNGIDASARLIAEVCLVSPQIADQWLSRNPHNRPVSQGRVREYAALMAKGEWLLSPDAIAFDWNGNLMNGQHRLWALIESEQTLTFLVVRGLHPEAFKITDTGKSRSANDVLVIEGYPNASKTAAALRYIYNYEHGRLHRGNSGRILNADLSETAARHGDAIQESIRFCYRTTVDFKDLAPPSLVAFVHYLYAWRYGSRADAFMEQLGTGIGISSRKSAVYQLRARLERVARSKEVLPNVEMLALFIKAANAYMHGRDLNILKWAQGGNEAFPVPDIGRDPRFRMQDGEAVRTP